MATEERFEISIPDHELEYVRTVDDLTSLVVTLQREQSTADPQCRTSRAFYQLRRGLMRTAGVARSAVSPKMPLADLIAGPDRRRVWQELAVEGVRLPRLELPRHIMAGVFAVSLGVPLAVGLAWVGLSLWLLPIPMVVSLPLMLVARAAVEPWRQEVPARCATVGDAARSVSLHAAIAGPLPRQEVAHQVKQLIHEQLCVPLDAIKPESWLLDWE